jgi:ArsR family transcriptional regulator
LLVGLCFPVGLFKDLNIVICIPVLKLVQSINRSVIPEDRSLEFKTRIFKVISDTNRLKILEILRGGERCQCEIIPMLDQSQPTVSRHLRLLEEGGLIRSRRDGTRMFYEVVDSHIFNVIDAVDEDMVKIVSDEMSKKIGL